MELECRMGNIRVPCTVNQALALLIQEGLPGINGKKSGSSMIVFDNSVPLTIHGDFEDLCALRFKLSEIYKDRPLNGSAIAKWMELMQVPDDCVEICRNLKPRTLNIIWQRSLRQRMAISTVIKIFAA